MVVLPFKKNTGMNIRKAFPALALAVICCCVLFACNDRGDEKTNVKVSLAVTSIEANKALVLKFYQALNDTNWALAGSMVDPAYKHYYVSDTGFASLPWSGFEQGYRSSLKAFPDWKLAPVKLVAEGDQVSVLLKAAGTHLGSFAGISPTRRKASAPVMLLHQLRNGKLIADWEVMNPGAFMSQLKGN
jgi:predicted ester cyclase